MARRNGNNYFFKNEKMSSNYRALSSAMGQQVGKLQFMI
jgi:hypothetical protein